jgi:mRNA-degrading endonuclease RelE of RelBE toxin-antitoxin system
VRVIFLDRFTRSFREAPERVRREFGKQLGFLLADLRHPSLRAKKYDEGRGIWQARVDREWRFYFRIEGDTFQLLDIIPHPK